MNREEYDKALFLAHHGIKGQKWGVRRFQNEDGSLTPRGERRLKKLISLNEKSKEDAKAYVLSKNDEFGYLKKNGYKLGENPKIAMQNAYITDSEYKNLADKSDALYKKSKESTDAYVKEIGKVSRSNYNFFTVVGHDRLNQILKDYDAYKQRNNSSETEQDSKMKPLKTDSSVTKKVKKDWNELSDDEFKSKYSASKETYAKRVEKYGDPYMNAPLAKIGKFLTKHANARDQKKIDNLDKDIKSFDQIKNGLKDKNGKTILSKEDVRGSVQGLEDRKKKYQQRIQNRR